MAPSKKKTGLKLWWWLALLSIPALWCVAAHRGWLDFFENKLVDWRFRARGEIDAPVKIVYVDIDSQSLSEIGGFPWSRVYFPSVCAALIDQAKARAVGIDIVFSENGVAESVDWKKRVEGNRAFGRYLFKNPPVVVAASYAAAVDRDINGHLIYRQLPRVRGGHVPTRIEPPELPAFRISENDSRKVFSPPFVGLIDTIDGGTRTVPAFAPTDAPREVLTYLHLSIQLARLYYGVSPDGVKIRDDRIDLVRDDGSTAASIPMREGQLVDVNWFSAWRSDRRNPRVAFSTVFNYAEMLHSTKEEEKAAAREFFAQPDFKDAIVLVGPVDPLLQDLATTPFDDVQAVPRVGIHGNMVKTIASGRYLHFSPRWHGLAWADVALTLGMALAVSGLAVAGGVKSLRYKLLAAVLLVGFVGIAFVAFNRYDFVLPMAAPLGATLTATFVAVGWQLAEEEKQKGRIKSMFGTYVSPALVHRMVESGEEPRLGGVEENITAYFSDIQSFSTFSEKLTPPRLVELMNEYLTACTDIVVAEGGTLDKYIGDAVVAMYGAPLALPDHAFRACVASQRVHRRIGELREKWRHEQERQWPEIVLKLQTRIGLNSGPAVVGNMGSHTRFNYTMMGDNVNLAARMESGAKSWGAYTMCTEATKLACEQHGGDRVVFRALGRIVVKGRTQAVPIYEVAALKEDITSSARECYGLFEAGLAKYYAQDWDGALALFAQSRALEPNQPGLTPGVTSNPSLVYLDIAAHYRLTPPAPDWDGVYVMKEK